MIDLVEGMATFCYLMMDLFSQTPNYAWALEPGLWMCPSVLVRGFINQDLLVLAPSDIPLNPAEVPRQQAPCLCVGISYWST